MDGARYWHTIYFSIMNSQIYGPYQAFYIFSMLAETESAIKNLDAINRLITDISLNNIGEQEKKEELIDFIQSFVNHAGAISRYFFPQQDGPRRSTDNRKNMHKLRGEYLRKIFSIEDDNPISNRNLRNAIEHFDERLDLLLENGIVGQIFPSLILYEPEKTQIPHYIFKAYYIRPAIFQVLEERYEIQPLANEIFRINRILISFEKNGCVFKS